MDVIDGTRGCRRMTQSFSVSCPQGVAPRRKRPTHSAEGWMIGNATYRSCADISTVTTTFSARRSSADPVHSHDDSR